MDKQTTTCFSRLRARVGNSTVDYLMITAVVAGVMFPIVNSLFGDKILGFLQGNRQRMVNFISQNKKESVPTTWFSQDRVAKVEELGSSNPKEIEEPTELGDVSDIQAPDDLKGPEELADNNELSEPGSLSGGKQLGGGKGLTGGSALAGGGGSGEGGGSIRGFEGGGGGNLSGDSFFGGGKKGGAKGGDDGGEGTESKPSFGSSVGSGEEEVVGTSGSSRTKSQSQEETKKTSKSNEEEGAEVARKKGMLDDVQNELETGRTGRGEIDWMFILKAFLIIFICFLLVIITLSNLRRR